jgi:ketosteroid isomerase-like protein
MRTISWEVGVVRPVSPNDKCASSCLAPRRRSEIASDIRDIQVAGNVAYEWGYFEAAQKSSDQQAPESLRAKLLRVMKRQPDGSWKFTRDVAPRLNWSLTYRDGCTIPANGPRAFDS